MSANITTMSLTMFAYVTIRDVAVTQVGEKLGKDSTSNWNEYLLIECLWSSPNYKYRSI